MQKGKYITIIILVIFIYTIGIIVFNRVKRTSYALNIPAEDSVYKIYLEQNSNKIEINDQEKTNDIVNVLVKLKEQQLIKVYKIAPKLIMK